MPGRPVALITGVGRTAGIGAGIAVQLAASGWDIAFTYWTAYDTRMTWGAEAGATDAIESILTGHGAAVVAIEADLTDTSVPARIFDETEERLGPVTALVICHCESVASGLLDTTIESFDRHFAVNTRATWLLIREFGQRFRGTPGNRAGHQPHQRPHRRQPAVRGQQGGRGPDHPGGRARTGSPRHQRQRRQPGPGGHRLDDRRDQGKRHPPDAARPSRHAAGHRAAG